MYYPINELVKRATINSSLSYYMIALLFDLLVSHVGQLQRDRIDLLRLRNELILMPSLPLA